MEWSKSCSQNVDEIFQELTGLKVLLRKVIETFLRILFGSLGQEEDKSFQKSIYVYIYIYVAGISGNA